MPTLFVGVVDSKRLSVIVGYHWVQLIEIWVGVVVLKRRLWRERFVQGLGSVCRARLRAAMLLQRYCRIQLIVLPKRLMSERITTLTSPHLRSRVAVASQLLQVHAVIVPCPLNREDHLYAHHSQHTAHGNKAAHSRVALIPEAWQTRVGEAGIRGGQQVHKGSRDQHPCPEVPAEKERIAGHWQFRKALDDDGEGAGEGAQ